MRLLAALGLAFFSLTGIAAAAPAGQPLAITLSGDGATADRLDRYAPGKPIAVSVKVADGATYAGVSLVIAGPEGEQRYPLAALPDGSFAGRIVLPNEGMFTAHLTTVENGLQTSTAPFDLTVAAGPKGYALVTALAVGLGCFFMIGGAGWWLLTRADERRQKAGARTPRRAA
jgi:hypothetical protein